MGGVMPLLLMRHRNAEVAIDVGQVGVVGAADDADLQIIHPGVSRHHVLVSHAGDRWFVEDAGSTNGTFYEGARIDRIDIRAPVTVLLGHPSNGVPVQFEPSISVAAEPVLPPEETTEVAAVSAPGPSPGSPAPFPALVVAVWALTVAVVLLAGAVVAAALID